MGLFDRKPKSPPIVKVENVHPGQIIFDHLKHYGSKGQQVKVSFLDQGHLEVAVGYVRKVSKKEDILTLQLGGEFLMHLPLSRVRNVSPVIKPPGTRPPAGPHRITQGPVGRETTDPPPPEHTLSASAPPPPPRLPYPDYPPDLQGDDPHTRAARRQWKAIKEEQDRLDELDAQMKLVEQGGGMGADWATIAAKGHQRDAERVKQEILEERARGYDRFAIRVPLPGDYNYIHYVEFLKKGGTEEQWRFPYGKTKSGFTARKDGYGDF